MPKANIAGKIIDTTKYIMGLVEPEVIKIVDVWNSLADPYQRASSEAQANRRFFTGAQWSATDLEKDDRIHRVYNYASSILRKFQNYEGSPGFDINVKYTDGDDPIALLMAEAAESLAYRIVQGADFPLTFLESRLAKGLYGTVFFVPIWNPDNKNGSSKGTLEINMLTPERCRVGYISNDFKVPEKFISVKRMTVTAAQKIYGPVLDRKVLPDTQIRNDSYVRAVKDYASHGNPLFALEYDDMVTVWNYWDDEKYVLAVGDQVAINREHKYKLNGKGFCPVVVEHNIYIPGFITGFSDLFFIKDMLESLNKLYSLLEETVEDNAYPIMFEINNSLRGKKLKRGDMRGKVVPMIVSPGEEGIRVLQPPVVIQPILAAIAEVKAAIFDVSSMPAAAFGAYQPNTKSGFQATVQMQPALQEIDARQLRAGRVVADLLRMSIAILEKEDSNDLKVVLPEEVDPVDGEVIAPEQEIKLEGLAEHEIEIVFGNPLPKDDVRVIQNETAKEKNGYQSRRTTMQKLGVENPSKEMELIAADKEQLAQIEAKVASIMAQAEAAAQQAVQGVQPGAGRDQAATGQVKPGQNPEQAFPTPEGEEEQAVETAGEAVAETSIM